jgi:hypothetical protein
MNLIALGTLGSVFATVSTMFLQVFLQAPPPAASTIPGVKELIDNPRVTICEVTLTKGQKWPMEKYPEDTLMVPVMPVSLRITTADGKATTVSLKPGDVRFWPKGTHQAAEPESDGRAIVAHFKDVAGPTYENTSGFGPAFPRPRVKQLLDNNRIVVWDYTWVQGEPTPNHFHDKDLMIVYLADGAIRSVTPDGKATPNEFKFAEVRFNPGNRAHFEEYVKGNGPRAVITELK